MTFLDRLQSDLTKVMEERQHVQEALRRLVAGSISHTKLRNKSRYEPRPASPCRMEMKRAWT